MDGEDCVLRSAFDSTSTLLASSCVITAAIKQREDSNTYCFLTDECKWCCFLVPYFFSWRIQCCFFGSSLFYWQMQMLHAHYTFVTFLIVQTIEHITISLQYVGLLIYYVLFSYSTLNSSGVMHQQLLKNPSLFIYFLSYLLPFFFLLSLSTVFLLFLSLPMIRLFISTNCITSIWLLPPACKNFYAFREPSAITVCFVYGFNEP